MVTRSSGGPGGGTPETRHDDTPDGTSTGRALAAPRWSPDDADHLTNSGEFLHSAPWNAGDVGRRNTSHGCVGLSTADSRWLYENS